MVRFVENVRFWGNVRHVIKGRVTATCEGYFNGIIKNTRILKNLIFQFCRIL